MDTLAIGKKLMGLREERGWSRDEVAQRSGLHANTVRNIELGADSMQLRSLDALAHVYGVDVHSLLDGRAKASRRRRRTAERES